MKQEDFRRMLSLVDDRYLQEAEDWRPRRRWRAWVGLAACLCLVIGWGTFLLLSGLGDGYSAADGAADSTEGNSGPAGADGGAYTGGTYTGHEDAATFMNYAGPVLPLTMEEENDAITAQRGLTFDFSGYGTVMERWTDSVTGETQEWEVSQEDLTVTDQYILTNGAETDQTVTLLYPFVDNLSDLSCPELTLDGASLETALYFGGYTGGFRGVQGAEETEPTTYNLNPADSWEDYQALLADGSYLADALYEDWSLDAPVTVYWFQNAAVAEGDGTAPTLALETTIDYDRTTVFTYGTEGRSWDEEKGWLQISFFVPEEDSPRRDDLKCMVVAGDDLTDYTLQGYQNGGCDPGTEIGVTCDVVREETTWGDILSRLTEDYWSSWPTENKTEADQEMLYQAVCQTMACYGGLSEKPMDRYEDEMLDSVISESMSYGRVFYAAATVTIPAGESVTFTAQLVQPPSYDFDCTGGENAGLRGYDLVTRVGTNLTFTGLTAELVNAGEVELIRQNYGFDPENGVTSVTLDLETEHYYMEVRHVEKEEEEP